MKCKKHDTPLDDIDCPRCGGNGYTDSDIEELDNPISWHDGNCFRCKGSGVLKNAECYLCEEEYRQEQERENDLLDDHMNNGRTER